jgi:hypothetical protein
LEKGETIMGNMSYCRFENTLGDLQDCEEHLFDTEELSESEKRARKRLIELCRNIAAQTEED